MSSRRSDDARAPGELDLFGLIAIFWPHRKAMLRTSGIVLAAGLGAILLLASSRYRSDALFLPPSLKDDSMPFLAIDMEDQLLGKSGVEKLLGGSSTPAIGVVKSRDVRLAVVEHEGLVEVYGASSPLAAAETLAGRTTVIEDETGAISMSVEDSDAERAHAILVAYLDEIEKRSERIVREKMSHLVTFLEERSRRIESQLDLALEAWQSYQEKTQVFRVETSAKSLSDILSNLIGTVAQAEAELRALETVSGESDPLIQHQKTYIHELTNHIKRLRGLQGRPDEETESPGALEPATGALEIDGLLPRGSDLPELAAAEQRFRLEIESKVKIAALLKSQFEMARLSLLRKEQHMVRLDPPVVPDRTTDRKQKLAVINLFIALLAGLAHGAGLLFWARFQTRVLRRNLDFPATSPARAEITTTVPPTVGARSSSSPEEDGSTRKPARKRARRRKPRKQSDETASRPAQS